MGGTITPPHPVWSTVFRGGQSLIPHFRGQPGTRSPVLEVDEPATYCFNVRFGCVARQVSFGSRFKDEQGMLISGAALHLGNRCIEEVVPGEEFLVEVGFICRLLPGIYYTDTGVSALVGGERRFLNRITDACLFKVSRRQPAIHNGLVHLEQEILVRRLEKSSTS